MSNAAMNRWAHLRLDVSVHPLNAHSPYSRCLDWRLSAKAPGDDWTLRSTVGFGSLRVGKIEPWPPNRDDMLALAVELLMGMDWTADGVTVTP